MHRFHNRRLAGCTFAALIVFSGTLGQAAAEDSAPVGTDASTIKIIEPRENVAPVNSTPVATTSVLGSTPPSTISNLIIRTAEKTKPSAPAIRQPGNLAAPKSAHGILQVVSNASRKPVVVASPMPAEPQPAESNSEDDVQPANHLEEIVQQADPVGQRLIQADLLSQKAATEAHYVEILRLCDEAIRLGADGENQQYAQQLISWSLNRRGQVRADEGKTDLALDDFETALNVNPANWRALHNRGVSLAQSGQFADAFDDFNRVIQLNPRFAKAHSNRATLYVQAKKIDDAIADFRRSIELDRNLVAGRVGLGRVYHMRGQLNDALDQFNAAVRLDSNNADILCSRADLLADIGAYGEALVDYARAIDLNPQFAHAYRNGSWLLATCPNEQFRDGEGALQGARQAIEFGYGQRHVALDTLAASLASLGRFDEAIATLQEAISLAPWQARATYETRLKLYTKGIPFYTQPVRQVLQASHQERRR